MHIKKQTVIPAGFKITRVDAGTANATPLKVLRAREEARLMGNTRERITSEQDSEARMERYQDARMSGMSESDALDESNGY